MNKLLLELLAQLLPPYLPFTSLLLSPLLSSTLLLLSFCLPKESDITHPSVYVYVL